MSVYNKAVVKNSGKYSSPKAKKQRQFAIIFHPWMRNLHQFFYSEVLDNLTVA